MIMENFKILQLRCSHVFVACEHAHLYFAMYISHVYTLEQVSHIYGGLFGELINED